MLSWEKKGLGK